MKNKKLPLKAFVIAVLIAATRLLSPESAEAMPVPPGWTGQDIANSQNTMNTHFKSNRDTDPMQWAARVKEYMLRGEGVWVHSSLDIHLDDRGRIIGKDTRTDARAGRHCMGGFSRLLRTDFVPNPQIHRTRKIDIRSFDGEVWKSDDGYTTTHR